VRLLSVAAFLLVLASCGGTKPEAPVKPLGAIVEIKAPLGLPPVPIPADNPPTADTIALGRILYYDKKLSGDDSVACANCHRPDKGYTDNLQFSVGVGGKFGGRNAPTVLNAAYNPEQFWDGRAANLELQAEGPIANDVEMRLPHKTAVKKLNLNQEYKKLFEKAYGPGDINMVKIRNSVASFERTLLSGNSRFDRYQFGGDKTALSPEAIHGLSIFRDPQKGNCVKCHTIDEKYALFTDGKYHNLGVGLNAEGELKDFGRFDVSKVETDKGAFRTPTLRNIALTGPYMHDGSQKTLRQVVDFYVSGGNSNPYRDKDIKELKLSETERQDLVAFLESLTGDIPK
jgi:cytochrome c peroxidase